MFVRDFTLQAYASVIDAALKAGYDLMPVVDWLHEPRKDGKILLLRHDVDRWPQNALAVAEIEARRNVRSTFYFRTVGSAFNPAIIRQISDLGHEVGYHYEDFYTAAYVPERAIALFERNLTKLRRIADIRTIVMHGSPLSRYNNMELWKHYDFQKFGVLDCILSYDWSDFVFFTDTGRRFDSSVTNLRDSIGARTAHNVRTSRDLQEYLSERRHQYVQFSTHPERWNDGLFRWSQKWMVDRIANSIKRGICLLSR